MDTLWAYDLTLIIIIQGYRGETKCLVYGGRANGTKILFVCPQVH
jgi:hypothetical protein